MLTQEHINHLLSCEWLPKRFGNTAYLAKFKAYPEDNICTFILTDTKHVWGEVVKSDRLARRYRELNVTSTGKGDSAFEFENDESSFRAQKLSLITSMHQLRHFVDAEFSVKPSQRSDYMVTLEYRSHRWSWEVESLGNQLSASILSEHLIIPLILTSSMVLNSSSGTVLADVSATDLQKEVDRTSKVAQRNPTLALVQALKRPRLTTTLNRVTAVTHSVEPEHLPSVVVDYDDIPESLETTYTSGLAGERYSQLSLNAASSTYTTQVTRPTPHPISRPSSPPPKDQPRGVAMDIEESMYTGPRLENIAIETFKDDGSATESDSEEAQSPPPPKKKRRLGDEGESTEEKGSPAPAKPTSKKGKASGSDSESSMEAPRRGTAAPSRGAGPSRVKQPIKRGGRRL